MASSTLIGQEVTRDALALIVTPQATDTWKPIPHVEVYDSVCTTLKGAGYEISKSRLAISHNGDRFFGTLDLTTPITDGITLAVGVRNSQDKSFPLGFCCGNRVMVCSNLSFHSEIVVTKRHTRFGNERYLAALATAVSSLPSYTQTAALQVSQLQSWQLSPQLADSLILRSYEEGLIGARLLPDLIQEWRHPQHEEFQGQPTGWKLWNCYTAILRKMQESNPSQAALTTIRLQALLTPPMEIIDVEFKTIQAG